MRSFPSSLVDSAARDVLLVPCLLICLACATPFPFEKLQEGMTTEAVRREFGAPEAVKAEREDASWCYHDQRRRPIFPERRAILLSFEDDKLVRWEKIDRWTAVVVFVPVSTEGSFQLNRGHWVETKKYRLCDSILPTEKFIPIGPQWIFDPSAGHSAPDTSCKPERTIAEGRAEAGDTRYVARNYVSLWVEPDASLEEERVSVDRGQPLKVLARRCQWCRVEDDLGTRGWVGCVFLTRDEPRQPKYSPATDD